MKPKIIILTLLVLMALAMIPVQAVETWNYFPPNSWEFGAYPADWPKASDSDIYTAYNNNGQTTDSWGILTPTAYYSKIRWYQGSNPMYWMINDVCVYLPLGNSYNNITISGIAPISVTAYQYDATCTVPYAYGSVIELQYLNGTPPAPIANFTGTPLNGTASLYVMFTDTSENEYGTCTYNWSLTPTSGISAGRTGTLEDHNALFSTEGNYTVSHSVSCDAGSNISTKTDYIMVLNGSVLGTLYITAINSLNGYPIQGATLNLNDVENGTWVNATTTTGTSQITGIKTHTVNVYASSPGFADNDKLGIPISNVYDSILLFPANMSNVSAGNVTLFVSVYEGDDHTKPIPNAGVNVIGPNGGSGQYTNGGGTAQFAVANKTTYLVDVQASGHRGASTSVYSGTGSGGSASVTVTVYLDKNTITPTATQTTLPGGGTPTPAVTVLPGCEINPSSPECQASQNNEAMAWISANGMGLVQFFVLCFIVFMIKGMGKR
jgi:PKD repeat protein